MSGRGPRPRPLLLVLSLAVLHLLLRPFLLEWFFAPDLAIGALLIATIHLRAGWAAGIGFVLGILEGAMALGGLGSLGAGYALAGYLGVRAWDLVFTDAGHFLPIYLASAAWTLIILERALGISDLTWNFILIHAPIGALATGLVCLAANRLAGASRSA